MPVNDFKALKAEANKGYCLYLPNNVISLNSLLSINDVTIIDENMELIKTLDYNAFEQSEFKTKKAKMTFEING